MDALSTAVFCANLSPYHTTWYAALLHERTQFMRLVCLAYQIWEVRLPAFAETVATLREQAAPMHARLCDFAHSLAWTSGDGRDAILRAAGDEITLHLLALSVA